MDRTDDLPGIELIDRALADHPGAAVLILPRPDGQYSGYTTDILGLFDEVEVGAECLTDPMLSGVHEEKAADIVLPLIFFAATSVATASDWVTVTDGVIHVVRFFMDRLGPKGNTRFRGAYEIVKSDRREIATVSLDLPGNIDPAPAIREALRPLRHD